MISAARRQVGWCKWGSEETLACAMPDASQVHCPREEMRRATPLVSVVCGHDTPFADRLMATARMVEAHGDGYA